eukprot:g23840.t1
MEEITQLQAQLAASRARVAELEAQAAQPTGPKNLQPSRHLAAPDGSWEEEKKDLEQQLEARRGHIDQLETEVEQLKLQTKRAASESKESEEIMQLQAQLSAAHTRVAELEAQAAQDQSLVVEEQPSGSKELEEILQLQTQLSEARARLSELEARALQEEQSDAGTKESEEVVCLQAQLSVANARVAELEAQAAQDGREASFGFEELEEIILQLQAQLSAAHTRVEQLEAQATQDEPLPSQERSKTASEDSEDLMQLQTKLSAAHARVAEYSEDFMQLQAKLSAAHTRVAELEAQAAQDKPVVLEARIVELEHELHELRSRTDAQASQEVKPFALDLDEPKGKDGGSEAASLAGDDGWDDFNFGDVQPSERKVSESKGSEEIMQLQAKLSAAHTRVAELEAQAAQDQSLAPKANFFDIVG